MQQLPLAVQVRDAASLESFHRGRNAEALDALQRMLAWRSGMVFLHGPAGVGKTHLLQGLARAAALQNISCAYVPLREAGATALLDGLDERQLLCVDDADAASDHPLTTGVALVRLCDALRARDRACAFAARRSPDDLAGLLPDLRTRLSACAALALRPLADEDREQLLRDRAASRGMDLPADVARYLVTRLPRETRAVLAALDELDRASLAEQRRLTIPFVQSVLRLGRP